MIRRSKPIIFILSIAFITLAMQLPAHAHAHAHELNSNEDVQYEEWTEEQFLSLFEFPEFEALACRRANSRQVAEVNEGNQKKRQFLSYCAEQTNNSSWCQQLVRPNPSSKSSFRCTYGSSQVHQLIHPDERTWSHAIQAVKLVKRIQGLGIKVCEIYNWWRPEPYNKNVGGAAGRHPYGTSVDVRFCSKADQVKAFYKLCEYRRRGEIRAIGYYGGTGLHFGIGDRQANTWGKSCP